MLITFAFGVSIDRTLWWDQAPELSVSSIPVEAPKLPTPVAVPTATVITIEKVKPTLIVDYDPEQFWVWGVFEVMGPTPKEFGDIDSIEIALNGHRPREPGYISLLVKTDPHEYEVVSASFALVTKRRLFFATEKMEGSDFEYRFEGEFLRTDFDVVAGKKIAVLRGVLTKSKDGRTITAGTLTFRMENLGC